MATKAKRKKGAKKAGSAVADTVLAIGELVPLSGDVLPAARQLVQAEVAISQEDVLSVAVSRAEDHINELIKAAQADATRLNEEAQALYRQIQAFTDKDAKETYSKRCEALVVALGAFENGKKAGFTLVTQAASLSTTGPGGSYVAVIHISAPAMHNLSISELTKAPAELVDLLRKARDTQQAIEEANNRALDAKRRIGQLPTLERKYRARLAEARIRSEQGGDELLRHLIGDVQADVLRLPGIR